MVVSVLGETRRVLDGGITGALRSDPSNAARRRPAWQWRGHSVFHAFGGSTSVNMDPRRQSSTVVAQPWGLSCFNERVAFAEVRFWFSPQFGRLILPVDLLSDTSQAPSLPVLLRLLPAECVPGP
jgi:hypothetical protein